MRVIVHLVPVLHHRTCKTSPECYNTVLTSPECYNAVLTVRYLLVAQPCQWLKTTLLKKSLLAKYWT